MATDLYLIAKIKTSKEEVLREKDNYLKQLKELNFDTIGVAGVGKLTGEWEYELPLKYEPENDYEIQDESAEEIICFLGPFVFNVYVYENCLLLSTIYKYRFLYKDSGSYQSDYLYQFRTEILEILNIFNAEKEIIYLADNGCDKLSNFLEGQVWEGVSYEEVKQNMIDSGIPFTKDYDSLDYGKLSYSNIFEYVYDDFEDIFNPEIIDHHKRSKRFKYSFDARNYAYSVFKTRKDKNIALIYAGRALEMLNKEASFETKFRYYDEYQRLSYLYIKLDSPENLPFSDQGWLYHQDIYKFKPGIFGDYLGKLIEKQYSEYLLKIFENKPFYAVFHNYYDVVIKLFVDENHPLDIISTKIYKDIQKGIFDYRFYLSFGLKSLK